MIYRKEIIRTLERVEGKIKNIERYIKQSPIAPNDKDILLNDFNKILEDLEISMNTIEREPIEPHEYL